jgi:hypothetical protein
MIRAVQISGANQSLFWITLGARFRCDEFTTFLESVLSVLFTDALSCEGDSALDER